MPHTYAFLWVLLLLRGNDIRFYRGKVQIKSEKLTPFGGIFSIMEKFDSMLLFYALGYALQYIVKYLRSVGLADEVALKL